MKDKKGAVQKNLKHKEAWISYNSTVQTGEAEESKDHKGAKKTSFVGVHIEAKREEGGQKVKVQ